MEGAPWRRGTAGPGRRQQPQGPGLLERLASLARTTLRILAGLAIAGLGVSLATALITHTPADPSLNSVTAAPPTNLLGTPGAWISDLLLQGFGLAAAACFGASALCAAMFDLADASLDDRVLLVDEMMARLENDEPESVRLITLKFFCGLTNQ
jgi:hypothetical protein